MDVHSVVSSDGNVVTDNEKKEDPYRQEYSPNVKEGDYMILELSDGKHIFAQAINKWKGKPPLKINKKSYGTANLIGIPYGTVLELQKHGLVPLENGEDVFVDPSSYISFDSQPKDGNNSNASATTVKKEDGTTSGNEMKNGDLSSNALMMNDNRNLVDNNQAQNIDLQQIQEMQKKGTCGKEIVAKLVDNSSTFGQKTLFSKMKYVAKKQKKHLVRCRIIRPTGFTVCDTMYSRDAKKIMNLRSDTLAQIMSYGNIYAGQQVLCIESCMGVITGSLAQRMGGYGKILSVFTGKQQPFSDMISKFNLTFVENQSIKYIHSGEIFGEMDEDSSNGENGKETEQIDWEAKDRSMLEWPCKLQSHTAGYLSRMETDKQREDFLTKRQARFARKLTRHTTMEGRKWLKEYQSDSLIIATKYDPKTTLMKMLPYLAPSCPFVVLCEYIEPLVECFRELQDKNLCINLRLSDTWMREYQILPGRTHPQMTMSQYGGYLLTGVKLDPVHGINEIDEETLLKIKAKIGGRRGRKPIHKKNEQDQKKDEAKNNRKKRAKIELES